MSATLDGVRLKIERAKEHIGRLGVVRTAFLLPRPYRVLPKYHPEIGEHGATLYRLVHAPPLPPDIMLITGDAIHNLRSALDHLIYQCGILSGLTEVQCRLLYFPICESAEKYKTQARGKIKGIRKDIAKEIGAIEPYQGGNGDILWRLHALSLREKHRLLLTLVIYLDKWGVPVNWHKIRLIAPELSGTITDTEIVWFEPFLYGGAKEGDVLLSMPGNSEDDPEYQFAFDIAFGEPEIIEGKPLGETLLHMANVVENIVASFTPFFV